MKKVLIIDDSLLISMYLSKFLAKEYQIITAFNALEGIEKLANEKPDCILSDLRMPEMDGFQFLQYLKEKEILVPVIIISSDTKQEIKDRCLSLGAFAILPKPVKGEELLKMVACALSQGN